VSSESVEPDFGAPVIIVGPGRSGTTLLDAMLSEHPDMYMIGETQFVMHRMWKTLWDFPGYITYKSTTKLAQQSRPEWRALPWYVFWRDIAANSNEPAIGRLLIEIENTEKARLAQEFAAAIAKLLIPPSLRRRHWGMKEIWIGSDSYPHSLDLYRLAFPRARYLCSARNPLTWLSSVFNSNNVAATTEMAVHELGQWVKMIRFARTLADAGRYLEFRYEDLVGDGGLTAENVFAFVGLELPDPCRLALQIRHLPSHGSNTFLHRSEELLAAVPGLREEMERLGYEESSAPPSVDPLI
jgi:hypothetical protein